MITKEQCKIVFMGTPDFAIPSLNMLVEEGYRVEAVFTQPDRPRGRGHKNTPPPVKQAAQQYGIPVYQYEKISRDGMDTLREIQPDVMITAAFGQILSRELLEIPQYGCINVHGSLLPKYRGAAPIQWAIINGETQSGVTTMFTKYELDAGDMLLKGAVEIGPEMSGGELYEALSIVGANVLKDTMEQLLSGTLKRIPQDEKQATYYPMLQKGFGQIDFSKGNKEVHDFIRALDPAPAAYAILNGDKIKIFASKIAEAAARNKPGTILTANAEEGLFVATGDGAVEITELQWPGSRRMKAKDFLRGKTLPVGERFTGPEE